MKIISLTSVGLGTYIETPKASNGYCNSPYELIVGAVLYNSFGFNDGKTIEKIEVGDDAYDGTGIQNKVGNYLVYTSDGHVRVLPADKYIAEWG